MSGITTASAIGLGLSAVGTGLSIFGQIGAGEAAASRAAYQAQVARNNAIIAEQMAESEVQTGVRKAEMKSLEAAARGGKIKAGMAARGVDLGSKSAVDVIASDRAVSALDTETTLANSALKAYGYRARAAGFEAEAPLHERAGSDARTAGYVNAFGTLLSRASSLPDVYKAWDGLTGTGAPGGGGGYTGTTQGSGGSYGANI